MASVALSEQQSRFLVRPDPLDFPVRDVMQFHLVYAGNLLKSGRVGHTWEKHQIRRYLHPQLKRLWETHPLLAFYTQKNHWEQGGIASFPVSHAQTKTEEIAKHFEGYVPLVMADFGMVCELEILFLRAEPAGNLLQRGGSGGGDIDNRMKVLFDGLCMPVRGQVKLRGDDTPDPDPMYVLVQDDSLITSLKVTADRFLAAASDADPADPAEACVIVSVNVKVADPTKLPYGISL
jgi:hypothetical protein